MRVETPTTVASIVTEAIILGIVVFSVAILAVEGCALGLIHSRR